MAMSMHISLGMAMSMHIIQGMAMSMHISLGGYFTELDDAQWFCTCAKVHAGSCQLCAGEASLITASRFGLRTCDDELNHQVC